MTIAGDSAGAALLGELRDSLSELGLVEKVGARARARDLSSDEAIAELDRSLSSRAASPYTVKMYRWAAGDFLSTVGKSPGAVTMADLEAYLQSCRAEREYSPATVHLIVHALRCLFASLGLKTASPLRAARTPPSLPRFLKEGQVRELLRACADDPRAYAIVSVLAYTGLRVGELCRLDVQDLDTDAGELLVRSGKGGKDRLVILDPAAVRAVRRHLRGRRSGLVFPLGPARVEDIVRQAAAHAGLSNRVTPHVLRHTLATSLLRRGCDIRFIQEQLGHASVAT
ncbi:MAG: tyrosine-type recombinase/integrase, partial [Thermoplasmata archaeon]